MTKHMRGVHVGQVPMRTMLVACAFVASTSLSLLFVQSASALPLGLDELVGKTVQPVVQLLPIGSSNQSSPPKSEPTKTSSPRHNSDSSQGATNSSSPVVNNSNPSIVTPEETAAQSLEPIAPIDPINMQQPIAPYAYLASTRNGMTNNAVFAQTTTDPFLPIQASEEGWRLFGVAWYWWLAATGALIFGIRYLFLSDHFKPVYSSAGQ